MNEQKANMIQRIYKTIAKRDVVKQLLLDNNDNWNPGARVLMKELTTFCMMGKSPVKVNKITGNIDPTALAIATGRREVYMRIMELINFSDESALKMIEQLNQQED